MPYSDHLKAVVDPHGDDDVGGGLHDEVGLHGDVSHHQEGDTVAAVTEDGHHGSHYFEWNDMARYSSALNHIFATLAHCSNGLTLFHCFYLRRSLQV